MVLIIGRFFLILFFFSSFLSASSVTLTATTVQGTPLKKAGVGHPFLLQVQIKDIHGQIQTPSIAGIEQFQARSCGYQMRMINGISEVVYQYRIRIDTAGTYTLGPAQVFDGTTTITSNTLTLEVAEEQVAPTSSAAEQTDTFLRVTVDKKRAFVGEKVQVVVRFYTKSPVELQQIIEPEIAPDASYRIHKKEGPFQGTQTIGKTPYNYAEWRIQVYPTRSGTCTIPAYGADYKVPSSQPHFFFSLMHPATVKRVYSNVVSLQVLDLPATTKAPDVIGTVTQFTASITPTSAKVGEGLVLTVQIAGDIDFDALDTFVLTGMPTVCKWYESKHYMQETTADEPATKCFEYIVQPLEPGTYEIPAQTLRYFDTQAQDYSIKTTHPLLVHVSGAGVASIKSAPPVIAQPIDTPHASITPVPPAYEGPWQEPMQRELPLIWFFMIVGGFASSAVLFAGYKKWKSVKVNRCAIKKQLEQARKERAAEKIYPLLRIYAAHYYKKPQADITQEDVYQLAQKHTFSPEQMQAWRTFVTKIYEYAYMPQTVHDPVIFDEALYWQGKMKR